MPRNARGEPHGIEDAHPKHPLLCTTCHGGNAWVCDGELGGTEAQPECDGEWVYDKERSHVSPGDGPKFLKNLSSAELDAVDPAYLRFINPGDLRIVDQTCGVCHEEAPGLVSRSAMTHTTGELTVARYRAGAQASPHGIYASVSVVDPNPVASDACSSDSLERFEPPPVSPSTLRPPLNVASAQDQYLVKSCLRCHLADFGENRFPGDFRSSGCTACHMHYEDDGLSRSNDPRINKQTAPHPATHELTTSPPIATCTHCHYRGGRLGISYQGYRESSGAGRNPKDLVVLGQALHGHDANYYIVDENQFNDFDETPPDLHFEAGMHCVDCHTKEDVHGDGHLYADTQCSVSIECTDCHGTVREYATLDPERTNVFDRDGKLYLTTKIGGIELEIPQVRDTITPGHPRYTAAADLGMGIGPSGYSHTDNVECYTCHSGWQPNCYGCHVEVDFTRDKRYQTTGVVTPGHPTGTREWVVLNDLVLMWNTEGMLAPSMPSERFFMSVVARDEAASAATGELVKKTLFRSKPRSFTMPDGRVVAGFGQRTFNPHTTRRRSQFMACDRCHSVGDPANPDNAILLDITYGFGSKRFPAEACDVTNSDDSCDPATDFTTYQLDAIQTRAGLPLVVVGHPDPSPSRPLSLAEIERMRQIVVPEDPPISTEIPPGAESDDTWPAAQKLE